MAANRIVYLGALGASLIFYAYYIGHFSFFFLMLVLLLPVFSLLLSLPSILGLSASISSPAEVYRKSSDCSFLLLRGRSRLPVGILKLGLVIRASDSEVEEPVELLCKGFTELDVELPYSTEHCREIVTTVHRLKVCDYLGLFSLPVQKPGELRVIIKPVPLPPIPEPELPPEINNTLLKPKPGGGYAEEHDLREYREGDSVRMIHWKVSAKKDELIVREPLEPVNMQLVITVDLPPDFSERDGVLDNLCWLSGELVKHELRHLIKWHNTQGDACSVAVSCDDELRNALRTLISSGASPKSAYPLGLGADWHYHLPLRGGGD